MRTVLCGLLAVSACGDDDKDVEGAGPDAGETGSDAGGESCTTQMYGKYKQAGFEAVNKNIIENIVKVGNMNPSPIGDTFKALSAEQVATVEANLLDFLVLVYGGPNNYKGRSMEASHKGLNITQAQYDAFVAEVIVPALAKAGVPESDIGSCFAPPVTDPTFVASIVGQ